MLKGEGLGRCACGGEALLIEHHLVKYPDYRYFTVGCDGECQVETGEYQSEQEAIDAWNRPADPPK